ncbi:Beta-lactamase class A [Pediococcus damnosus]|uniref:Beta-lactamase class A n=2 Tax=Pediococcus damnosus TaxID=51663 RepID=A0A143AHN1_9LACO|nr:Beta-lactamase class A [Pediococcus damnosus]AMV65114.1 Beta-lactamase class A [Pediococcus damnosus]AMV66703.1 Beta-lactamase class A [Pediococcus damnosus]AMV69927.1 Beta-lactamase class A [Pediococcus damnosus]PIO81628.1 serine hydrolase [Pediococcus damnosus]
MGAILVVLVILQINGNSSEAQSKEANKANQQADSGSSQVIKKQSKIKSELANYLKTVTKDGTVSVSFYNLGAPAKSEAATGSDAAVYKAGSLATESNAHSAQTAASTYKLFIAAYLMQQKQAGNFSWTAANEAGFYQMIVDSANTFADSELQNYSMASVNKFIADQGWYSPVFQETVIAKTTSHSLMLLLGQLNAGTGPFKNANDRKKILNLMSKQIYRTGIPAGAREAETGTKVADKVGFLNDTNNDAGIVTLPNGQKYILVIMTHGHGQSGFSGFPKMAEITKKVQTIVYGTNAGE